MLTKRLVQMGVSHYLLRAAPDGEGNWFQEEYSSLARAIRSEKKNQYTPEFIAHMLQAIENRLVPLLVDIGGKPQGQQLDILRSCTHFILLYRTPEELHEWQQRISGMSLQPIAVIKSVLEGEDYAYTQQPVLQGVICGLDRAKESRKSGLMVDFLLGRIANICKYDQTELEARHLPKSPLPVRLERELAQSLNIQPNAQGFTWAAADLKRLPEVVSPGQPLGIYGRGPVWLVAALAVIAQPAEAALFDVRYGWLPLQPLPLRASCSSPSLQFEWRAFSPGQWLEIHLTTGILEPEDACAPENSHQNAGLVISGKLPRWYFARLSRHFAPLRPWVGIFSPQLAQIIIVAGSQPGFQLGDALPYSSQ